MRKNIILIILVCVMVGNIVPAFSEESRKGSSIGVHYGGASLIGSNHGNLVGAEFMYRFKERMAVKAEFSYASTSSTFKTSGQYFTTTDITSYSLFPVDFTFLYFVPLNNKFSAYFGAGGGYYSLSIKEESWEQTGNSQSQQSTETYKLNALAPHLCIGFEADISKRFGIYGETKYFVAKDTLHKNTEDYFSTEQDINFGGPQLKIGLRFYF